MSEGMPKETLEELRVVTINGKRVTFRESFPADEYWDLPMKIQEMADQSEGLQLRRVVPVLCDAVESWEYDGDPSDPSVYGRLDIFRDITPLATAVGQYITRLTNTGESASAST